MGAYLIVLFVVLIGTAVLRRGMLRGRVPVEPVPIDPYLAAHLAGGPDRVALTVLTEMVDEHQLAVDGRGRVTIPPGDAISDPMRVAVLRGFQGEAEIRVAKLYQRACRQPEMRGFGEIALRRGMRYEPAHRRLIMVVPLPPAVLAVAGVVLVFVEVGQGPGVVMALPLAIFVGVLSIVLMASTPKATPLGRQALKYATPGFRLHSRSPEVVVVDGRTYAKSAYAVATLGQRGIVDRNLEEALFPSD